MKLERLYDKKKKSIAICILICVIFLVSQSFGLFEQKKNFNFTEETEENFGDLYFAYYVDGEKTTEMPSKESGYTLSSESNCTNGVIINWDAASWSAVVNYSNFKIENKSRTTCNLYFRKMTFEEAVVACSKDKAPATLCMKNYENLEEDLIYDETTDNNLRYIGANPNNYVYFNCDDSANQTRDTCELWRIIGSFNNIVNGTQKETRIKLIRNESIGNYSWDTSDSTINEGNGVNEWGEADVMKLLNPNYENETVGGSLYWNRQSGTCYNGKNNATIACDFSDYGLKTLAKFMIDPVEWNTGANGSEESFDSISASRFYQLERSNNTGKICSSGISCNDTVSRTSTWGGYVGLMSPSDYGYATSGGTTTDRETCLNTVLYDWQNSEVSDCKINNWLYKSGVDQSTLTSYSALTSASYLFHVDGAGMVSYYANLALAVSPVVYLKANSYIISGLGTVDTPYQLVADVLTMLG